MTIITVITIATMFLPMYLSLSKRRFLGRRRLCLLGHRIPPLSLSRAMPGILRKAERREEVFDDPKGKAADDDQEQENDV